MECEWGWLIAAGFALLTWYYRDQSIQRGEKLEKFHQTRGKNGKFVSKKENTNVQP